MLIQESQHRLLVFQGVTSCDAVFIPGLNILIILCHISHQQISQCLEILSRTPDFFEQSNPTVFTGYLVGHSRPYHCNYDYLLLCSIFWKKENSLLTMLYFPRVMKLFSTHRSFGSSSGTSASNQRKSKRACPSAAWLSPSVGIVVLSVGHKPDSRSLLHASHLDANITSYSTVSSTIATSGALALLEEFKPLIWIGVTGQKRCWLEQVNGVAYFEYSTFLLP